MPLIPSTAVGFGCLSTHLQEKSGSGDGELVGFVCGTCSQGEELSHESMHLHDPTGQTLCIHSVAVTEKFRRRGFATAMLTVCEFVYTSSAFCDCPALQQCHEKDTSVQD